MIKRFTCLLALVLIGLAVLTIQAAENVRPLYIIFDGSNSMWGELPDKSRKIETARGVFDKLDTSWFEGREVALRLYGHRRAKDCADTELAVPFTSADDAKAKLSEAINSVTPRGRTPITRSLTAALKDFDGRAGEILLISDGIETCDADPCELVEEWQDQNIDIRVHVVGLGLEDMAREAMQCISRASGTEYMDANNVGELSRAIEVTAKAPAAERNPKPPVAKREFKIVGVDENGKTVPVKGTITKPGMEATEIKSNNRYVFDGGDYAINVGVPTVNDLIYKPITQEIKINDSGSTRITVTLPRPPSTRTRFIESGEEVGGTTSYSYVDDVRDFGLRAREDYFIMPGSYEFRVNLRTDNSDVRSSLTIADGEDKDIVFELIETVHTTFNVVNKDTGKRLRQHQELWQGGEKKYQIHYSNGAKIQPGTYTLKSPSVLTAYEIENVEVPANDRQRLEFAVALGKAQIHYRVEQKDPAKPDIRCWLYSIDENNEKSARGSTMQTCDGRDIYLSEGTYWVYTTKTFGKFKDTYFDVKQGETATVEVFLEE